MKAIILAAGYGSRLGKYTIDAPKGLLQIGGKSLLEIQIGCFRNAGITDISIVRGYKGEKIKLPGVKYYSNDDYESTNMVVSLMKAAAEFDDTIIISYSDIIFEQTLLDTLLQAEGDAVVLVDGNWKKYWTMRYDAIHHDTESLVISEDNSIIEIGRPDVSYLDMESRYIGMLKFSRNRIQDIVQVANKASIDFHNMPWKLSGNTYPKAYMTDLLQAIVDEGMQVKAATVKNGWLEFDTESDYEKALTWVESGSINALFCDFSALIK